MRGEGDATFNRLDRIDRRHPTVGVVQMQSIVSLVVLHGR